MGRSQSVVHWVVREGIRSKTPSRNASPNRLPIPASSRPAPNTKMVATIDRASFSGRISALSSLSLGVDIVGFRSAKARPFAERKATMLVCHIGKDRTQNSFPILLAHFPISYVSTRLSMDVNRQSTSLNKSKIKIVLLEGIHATAIEMLQSAGYCHLMQHSESLSGDALRSEICDCHMLGIRSRTRLTASDLASATRLIAVGCFCIGTNQVELNAATSLGIPVFNAPYSNTRSVAELVIAEAILLLRRVPEKEHAARQGFWRKSADGANEVRGKTMGIVGYGNIGTQVSVLAEAVGMKVVFTDVVTKLPLGNARQVPLAELLRVSNVVTLHVPETPSTQNMIGLEQLELMRPDAVLINAARGSLIDLEALETVLSRGRLRGVAIDVFPDEPKSGGVAFESPLFKFDNVLLTPHIGGSTVEAQQNIGREVAEKLVRYSDLGSTVSAVNFPEVALPAHANQHRLLHIHQNRPGVMSEINRVFSSNQINILGQYLQTNASVGYVVVDIDREYSELAMNELRKVDGTIRCRVLW